MVQTQLELFFGQNPDSYFIHWTGSRFTVDIPGVPFPGEERNPEQYIEVYVDDGSIDVITRLQSRLVNAIADGLAKHLAHEFGELEKQLVYGGSTLQETPMTNLIELDFDGVLHSYQTPWQGESIIPDPPVEGAFNWVRQLVADPRFSACIYSSRSRKPEGIAAMRQWLLDQGMEEIVVKEIGFPTEKPPSWLKIDDRGFHFKGDFPPMDWMDSFRPWNKQ